MDVIALLAVLFTMLAFAACVLFVVLLSRMSRNNTLVRRVEALEREAAHQRQLLSRVLQGSDSPPASVASTVEPSASRAAEPAVAPALPSLPLSSSTEPPLVQRAAETVPHAAAQHVEAQSTTPLESKPPPPRAPEVTRAPHSPAVSPTVVQPAPPKARTRVEWEQWFGVKGAALIGGAILALAGLLFVQYSIERGWLGPAARCSLGALAGIAALITSAPLRSRRFVTTSDAVAGAGATMILGATWAAFALYELIPFTVAFVAMAATTATCGMLAVRRSSQTIAWFGLIGGFATPLLLSLGSSTPLGLFLYLLALDVAVLALARHRAWSGLASAAAIATQLLFGLWIALHFDPRHASWALLFTGGIALVFTASRGPGAPRAASWIGAIVPFAFAAYFAGQGELGSHVHSLAALLLVLTICSTWLAQRHDSASMQIAGSIGAAATLTTWLASCAGGTIGAYEGGIATLCLGAVPWLGAEIAHRRAGREWSSRIGALAIAPFAASSLFGVQRIHDGPLQPWMIAGVGFALFWLRLTRLGARATWTAIAQVLPLVTYALWRDLGNVPRPTWSVAWGDTILVTILAVAAVFAAWTSRATNARRETLIGVIVLCALAMAERAIGTSSPNALPAAWLATTWSCAVIGVFCARELRSWFGYLAICASAWLLVLHVHRLGCVIGDVASWRVCSVVALGLLLAAVPSWDATTERVSRNMLRASALVLFGWEFAARLSWKNSSWSAHHEVSVLLFVLCGAALAWRLREHRVAPGENGGRSAASTGFVWLSLASVFLIATAVDRIEASDDWTLAAAVFVAASAWIARIALHTGVRWIVAGASVWTGLGLLMVLLHIVQRYDVLQRTGWPVWHELSYLIGAPALALFAAAYLSRASGEELESSRWPRIPWLPSALSLFAVLTTFFWLNVEVINVFSDGPLYAFEWTRRPPRDVALSVTWTCYALTLLVLGVRFDRSGLRWTSLAFFLATIGKVFLYDLGELRGLHRVGSLVGLALALLAVSVLYQRLVFRSRAAASPTPEVP